MALLVSIASPAAAVDYAPAKTYPGHGYQPSVSSPPSADKPQSKIWWNDGAWWALMLGGSSVHIYKLGGSTWRDTGTVVDSRATSTGDALSVGEKLYVASRTGAAGSPVQVSRFSYSVDSRGYTRDSGFPISVPGSDGTESVTIARDTMARLWVTFTKGSLVYVARTVSSDSDWGDPFEIPGGARVAADDISAVMSLPGKIGVMWSDQASSKFRFAVHVDTAPDLEWTVEDAYSKGSRSADDHINLKSLLGDDSGRVYAAVKTSLGDVASDPSSAPEIVVLTRSASGNWTSANAVQRSLKLTRPQLALDRTNRQLVLLASDEGSGSVYYKTASLGTVTDADFTPTTKGSSFMKYAGASINNVSTTKDPVDATTGLVGIGSDTRAHTYYHSEMPLGTPDTTGPTVVSRSPAQGATGVGLDTQVSARFSEPVNSLTVSTRTVTLTGPGGPVPATVTYDATSLAATLTPASVLADGATYTATVSTGVRDQAGNSLPSTVSWSFTTAAAQDSPPIVTSVTPADGTANVGLTARVTATFSEPMAAGTITPSSFVVAGPRGPLGATVTYDPATRTAVATPSAALLEASRISVTIGTAVTDAAGTPLTAPRTWSFTTVGSPIAAPGPIAASTPARVRSCNGLRPTIVGTNGNDTIRGTKGPDVIVALGGRDIIKGRGGNDTICAGAGADQVRAGHGDDVVRGGPGDDWLIGASGSDTLFGGGGDDTIAGKSGDDTIAGRSGDDTVRGNRGADDIAGNRGADLLRGGKDDDTMRGGKDDDVLRGGPGFDSLTGGPGTDECRSPIGGSGCELPEQSATLPGDAAATQATIAPFVHRSTSS